MTNLIKTPWKAKVLPPSESIQWNYMWRGWDDVANGRGWPADYDSNGNMISQRNYERGRQAAAAAKSVLGYVPRWKRTQLFNSIAIPQHMASTLRATFSEVFSYFNKDRLTNVSA